jgi:hypothetical protein
MDFDVKYDLRHKARLVANGNWTVNDKEDIYSGVFRMDTVRMGFFLGELYLLHVVHVTSEISSYMKHKREIYITAGPDFGANLHGKILIIDESLY